MRRWSRGWRFPFAAVALVLMAGCGATLSSNQGGRPEAGGLPVVVGEPARPGTSRPSAPPAPESTEQTIERILKGK